MPILNLGIDWSYTERGIKNLAGNAGKRIARFDICKGQTLKLGFKLLTDVVKDTSFTVTINGKGDNSISFIGIHTFSINKIYEKSYVATENTSISVTLWGNADSEIFEFQLWAEIDELTDYKQYEQTDYILDIQQEMLNGDYFIKEEDGWKEVHAWKKYNFTGNETLSSMGGELFYSSSNIFSDVKMPVNNSTAAEIYCNVLASDSYNNIWSKSTDNKIGVNIDGTSNPRIICKQFSTATEFKEFLQQQYNSGNPVYVYYKTETPTKLPCTEKQSTVLEELSNLDLFEGVNNIITTEDIALLILKYIADTKTYIDNKLNTINQQILEIAGGN